MLGLFVKVRKEVSLTVDTAQIANRMNNFSQWVRIGLRAYKDNMSLGEEVRKRIKWAQCAQYLASYICDHPELSKGMEQHEIISMAMNHAQKQMSLEDFE